MRSFLAGLAFLVIASNCLAQATGFVEGIGFDRRYRPDCWAPMLVNLSSQSDKPQDYVIQVQQDDLDRDRVIYSRQITLNPRAQEKFWVYFLPKPTNGGLPDAVVGTRNTAADLEKALTVWLCTTTGEQIVKLPPTGLTLQSVEPRGAGYDSHRGKRLILYVTNPGSSRPATSEWQTALGMSEDIEFVQARPQDLPENPIGYEAIDSLVWLDANAADLTAAGSRRRAALDQWLRQGGRLVVCQPADRFKIEDFADLLPVQVKDDAGAWKLEVRDHSDLTQLIQMARYRETPGTFDAMAADRNRLQLARWEQLQTKNVFKFGHAAPKPGAFVEEWMTWDESGGELTPYLARSLYGLGCVTWVAQDLGAPALISPSSSGWPYVWDRVLGYRDLAMRVKEELPNDAAQRFIVDNSADLGGSLNKEMEHQGRAGSYIAVAVLFFIGYWVVAGPGGYFFLASKGRKETSWPIFAATAVAATLLTLAVVQLVLRGRAEAHHVTLVRAAAGVGGDGTTGWEAVMDSRVGLYIPASSRQRIGLSGNDTKAVSWLTPLPIHPDYLTDDAAGFSDKATYTVPVRDDGEAPVEIDIPYRSTLKKLEARWVGPLGGAIEGSAGLYEPNTKLVESGRNIQRGYLDGVLINKTGVDLKHVHFAFYGPWLEGYDYILYVPEWPNGKSIDLRAECNDKVTTAVGPMSTIEPGAGKTILGYLSFGDKSFGYWDRLWTAAFSGRLRDALYDDSDRPVRNSFVMLSLFDRVVQQPKRSGPGEERRAEVLRRGARRWDISGVVAAGGLAVLAQSAAGNGGSPLPYPLDVEGKRVAGSGTVFYQFAVSLDHSKLPRPTTQPAATQPATTQSAKQ